MGVIFDYESAAQEAGVSESELARLIATVREQYGPDTMLAELRILRTVRAIGGGRITLADAVAELAGPAVA